MRFLLVNSLVLLVACGDSDPTGSGAAGASGPSGGAGGEGAGSSGGNSSGGSSAGGSGAGAGSPGGGHFTFGVEGGRVFRVAAAEGAPIEDISAVLDGFSLPLGEDPPKDLRLVPSFDGSWLTVTTNRVVCDVGECLALLSGDLLQYEDVIADGAPIAPRGTAPINDAGTIIVYASDGGPHAVDLFRIERSSGEGVWSAPALLTADSPREFNNMPALSLDESRVYFDCGATDYPEDGDTDSCSVNLDGTGFTVVVTPSALPNPEQDFTQFPHASVDGVLFQGTWPIGDQAPETIWLLPNAGGDPQPIGAAFTNAVSPCGLSDGRFGLLWLDGPNNPNGFHELTLVDQSGALISVLTPGIDVLDIGIGCSN